ncbi:hypothetical protein DM02DRAFT_614950 [Periconia macrospinosa]|uniref:Tudor domain-containing protein n=1 Tax=Periconia macrospinosa TaxID=97972 RepID=A0A2V1DQR0_9PLEO|nr:hypothetical protein DM02DRAFT_614950 [Periconia macrospinosa]
MSADVQQLKNDIWRLKQKITDLEGQRKEWQEQLAQLNQLIEYGAKDEVLEIKPECESNIADLNAKLEPLYKERDAMQAKLPEAPKPAAPKFDVEKHPVLKKMVEKADAEADVPAKFDTGDIVEAQWADKQFYKAKIQTILGSKSAPKYHIKFLDYDESMTVDRESLRAIPIKRKREPEEPAVPVTSTPQVISGPVSVNPEAKKAKGEASPADTVMPRRRNIPNKKTLEKGVNNWKSWSSKGVGKKIAQKDSMFRSGTHEGSRVGFTGSGAGMTASQQRLRHNTKDDMVADLALEESLKAAQSPRKPEINKPFEARESREFREPRESREFREPRESRESREPREPREPDSYKLDRLPVSHRKRY